MPARVPSQAADTTPGIKKPIAAIPMCDGERDHARRAVTVAAESCLRTLDEPNQSEADDALNLVRMDDDGGLQMPRPPA